MQGAKKKFVLSIESWTFTSFFHGFVWCHLQCDRFDLNTKFLMFFRKIYKFHNVGVLNIPTTKGILYKCSTWFTNDEQTIQTIKKTTGFSFILKWRGSLCKRPSKKKTFASEQNNLVDPMGQVATSTLLYQLLKHLNEI